MALKEYKRKRDFKKTPEPAAKTAESSSGRLYVIQKHAASRLHYDFRLELDGVLLSWAVPKGPMLDPAQKHLAVQVEDHPVDYGGFEGIIPKGEYGGGTVLLWDRGEWEPLGDPRAGLKSGKLKFKLHGEKLRGGWTLARMRTAGDPTGKNWLLIKERDETARPLAEYDILKERPESVASGRSMEEIAEARERVWSTESGEVDADAPLPTREPRTAREKIAAAYAAARGKAAGGSTPRKSRASAAVASDGAKQRGTRRQAEPVASDNGIEADAVAKLKNARRAAQPEKLSPQLAVLVKDAPEGAQWLHEIKFDGYRLLIVIRDGKVRLITRKGNDWTAKFPTIAKAADALNLDQGIIDGEVVALDDRGRSVFQRLQNALQDGHKAQLAFYAFDLPHYAGFDLMKTPLIERKTLLRQIVEQDGVPPLMRYSDHQVGDGPAVFQAACKLGVEGIVSKRSDSAYETRRSPSWLKLKCLRGQEFVICGFSEPSGARSGFGALLLGFYDAGGALTYCGRVGTGFTDETLDRLHAELKRREQKTMPFEKNRPRGADIRGVHWVRPELVCEVVFGEWTDEGILRHPAFKGLREDRDPRQITREVAAAVSAVTDAKSGEQATSAEDKPVAKARVTKAAKKGPVVIAGVTLSNPEKFLYPDQEITKRHLAEYYESIADWVLPHFVHRPLTIVRCPNGVGSQCFYQKHLKEGVPKAVYGIPISETTGEDIYLAIRDLPGLISLVQLGVLEFHPWGSREDKLEQPDRLTFDLDPGPGVKWEEVIAAAKLVRDRLAEAGLTSFCKTSGGKGLHIVVPLAPRAEWEAAKAFTKALTEELARSDPSRFVAVMTKSKRTGKIFIDYLRNGRGATSVAAYSTRARPGAPVSTPVSWDELSADLGPATFDITNVPERLRKLRRDPWEGFLESRQSLTKAILKKAGVS